jgi:hypothetical protein
MYKVESRGHHNKEWHIISSSRAGHQEFDDLDDAIKAFEYNCTLARFINYCKVTDETNKIFRYYNPELDERLPGCLWRLENRAKFLWKNEGSPSERDDTFWFEAKRQIEQETSNLCGSPVFSEYGDLEPGSNVFNPYSIWKTDDGHYIIYQTLVGAFAMHASHIKELGCENWDGAVKEFDEFLLENNIDESNVIPQSEEYADFQRRVKNV